MAINKRGKWWKGSDFQDLADYVRILTEESNPARVVLQSMCGCRGALFRLEADQDEGCARRSCVACGVQAFIGDSEEYWHEAEPVAWKCVCGHDTCEIGVGFAFREDEEISWVTLGQRCAACGVLGSLVDWKVDYAPTDHLFEKT